MIPSIVVISQVLSTLGFQPLLVCFSSLLSLAGSGIDTSSADSFGAFTFA